MKMTFDLPPDVQQHLDLAYSCEESQDFENALRECVIVLQAAPSCAEAYNLHGMILEGLGQKAKARKAYEMATQLAPGFVEASQNLLEIKAEIIAENCLEVELSTSFKIVLGGATLFFLCAIGMSASMLASEPELWPIVPFVIVGGGGFWFLLWWNQHRYPRTIDEEGITTRSGLRVVWKDLVQTERVTGKVSRVRISGSLKLHFRGGKVVEIVPNSITPASQVVHYVAQKTGAYPG